MSLPLPVLGLHPWMQIRPSPIEGSLDLDARSRGAVWRGVAIVVYVNSRNMNKGPIVDTQDIIFGRL